jgi:hypothetical protein
LSKTLTRNLFEHKKAMISGDLTASEPEKAMKDIVAVAAATSGPVTALLFDGSVVAMSTAGITSGLAALGLGGVLGVSAMVTGIGAVIVLGVAAYLVAHRAMGGKERELANKLVKQHQDSISELDADIENIAARMEEYTSRSKRNEETLARLKSELRLFKGAPGALEDRRER